MKNIVRLCIFCFVSAVMWACTDPFYDTELDPADFFVSFETNNALFTSASIIEGDTVLMAINVSATAGSPVTVDFTVELPQATEQGGLDYQILDLNNNPISQQLTFPEGTGTQSFKFVAPPDNNMQNGDREFVLKITGNSAGYNIGVGSRGEAATFPITVADPTWMVLGMGTMTSQWYMGETYPVEISKHLYEPDTYRIENPYTSEGVTGDFGLIITTSDGTATVARQLVDMYQAVAPMYATGSGTFDGTTFTLTMDFVINYPGPNDIFYEELGDTEVFVLP